MLGEHDVIGFDVAVYEAEVVGFGESGGDLMGDPDGEVGGEALVAVEAVGEGFALDVFHAEEEDVEEGVLAPVEDADGAGVFEGLADLGFAAEAGELFGVVGVGVEDLEGDEAAGEAGGGEIDVAEAAAAEGALDAVAVGDPGVGGEDRGAMGR